MRVLGLSFLWITSNASAFTTKNYRASRLSTSPLFAIGRTRTSSTTCLPPPKPLPPSQRTTATTPLHLSSSDAHDAEIVGSSAQQLTSQTNQGVKSLFYKFDRFGLKLKPKAVSARNKAITLKRSDHGFKSFLYTTKACLYLCLFILYRGYRGFFVILPAVFREVYRRLDSAVDTPFDDTPPSYISEISDDDDIDPQTGKIRPRTAITTSVLATLLTFSYVMSGALKVVWKFVTTITKTRTVEPAFEAAADEVLVNEGKIMTLANRNRVNGDKFGF